MKHFAYPILFFCIIGSLPAQNDKSSVVISAERERVIENARKYIDVAPITVTATTCERSSGGIHDFYSEGDYWWPDPKNPDGPYIRKDGMTNPENFTAHREAMIRFSQISGALASAYIITGDDAYVSQLLRHLKAWFIDEATLMHPNLLYGQAIKGRVTGRGIGIIDTIHLMEVAKAVLAIKNSTVFPRSDLKAIKTWFATYLDWIFTHPYGIAERDNGNNHSVCWALQAAVFAELVQNKEVEAYCRNMYKSVLLPDQMAGNGSFPLELKRTKPYGYSLFTLDAMTAICQVLSNPKDNLFTYDTFDGKNIGMALEFLFPYVKNKKDWPYKKDVMYWSEWPVKHSSFLFGGIAFDNDAYIHLWQSLNADFDTPEVVRNMPIRYPLLWIENVN